MIYDRYELNQFVKFDTIMNDVFSFIFNIIIIGANDLKRNQTKEKIFISFKDKYNVCVGYIRFYILCLLFGLLFLFFNISLMINPPTHITHTHLTFGLLLTLWVPIFFFFGV